MSEILTRVDECIISKNLGTGFPKKEGGVVEVRRNLSEVLIVGEFNTTVMPELHFESQQELRNIIKRDSEFNPMSPFEDAEDVLWDEKEKRAAGFCLYNLAQNSFGEYNHYRLGSFIYRAISRGEVNPPNLNAGEVLTECLLGYDQISQRRAKTYVKAAELVKENNSLILKSLEGTILDGVNETKIEFGIPTIAEMAVLEVKRPELFLAFDYYWTSTEITNRFGEKSNLVIPGKKHSEIIKSLSLSQDKTHPNIGFLVVGRERK